MSEAHSRWDRIILHADMDAFYAAVEQLDDPALRGRPILIGPDSPRGVVLTASYEARPFGVGSAMPMVTAKRKCPDALVVPPRFDRYREVSARVMASFSDFSPRVEAISFDEAFLDMSGSEGLFGAPAQMARKLKQAIVEATGGLTATVGASNSKFVAKVASNFRKPDGLTVVEPGDIVKWLEPQSLSVLWGAGRKTQATLRSMGFVTVGDVARADPEKLRDRVGKLGQRFYELANGRDERSVDGKAAQRSLSCECTLARDIQDRQEILKQLRSTADRVAARLRKAELAAQGVRIKLKTTEFRLLSRQRQLPMSTSGSDEIYATAAELAEGLFSCGPFRLIGVAAFGLVSDDPRNQLDLVFGRSKKADRLDNVLDSVAARFGPGALKRATQLSTEAVHDESTNLDFLER